MAESSDLTESASEFGTGGSKVASRLLGPSVGGRMGDDSVSGGSWRWVDEAAGKESRSVNFLLSHLTGVSPRVPSATTTHNSQVADATWKHGILAAR